MENLTNVVATFLSKDQNWMDGTTTYWFELNGYSFNLDRQFTKQIYGVVDCGGMVSIVEHDGAPVQNAFIATEVIGLCVVTETMGEI